MEKEISQAVIRRMPRYYRYLGELLDAGVERISSNELSSCMHVTASQIRQDLNNFGGFGQQGYGYNVQYLYDEIGKILGLNETHNVIVIGIGNLGQAIANYVKFEKLGFKIVGLFDVNPALKGKEVRDILIRMLEELPEFVKTTRVDIVALTLQSRMQKDHGMLFPWAYIWNLSILGIRDDVEDMVVENVHLSDSLMQLGYNIANHKK